MHKKNFVKHKLAFSISVALAASSITASGQENQSDSIEEEIVVTGIRGSLQRAQEVKMSSTGVVEAISAEDIGKLPDSSIAESLARLPGLAGERRNGRTSGLSVRGFREDFVTTTLNGRELIGIGDNRGVEYDLYPSEIISGATIYKTADASLVNTGVGGTVDLETVRPLDAPSTLAFTGSYESNGTDSLNPDYDDTGHRFAANFSDNYMDGMFGVSVAYATTESPNQTEYVDLTPFGGYGDAGIEGNGFDGVRGPVGLVVANRSRVLERDTFSGVLQFAPTDSFTVTVDYLDIDFTERGINRGLWTVLGNVQKTSAIEGTVAGSNVVRVSDGTITRAVAKPDLAVYRSEPLNLVGELETVGANFEFSPSDNLKIEFDYANSESSKSEQRAESYAGVGRVGLASQGQPSQFEWVASDIGVTFLRDLNNINYSHTDLVRLAGPQAWGGGMASVEELQPERVRIDYPNLTDDLLLEGFRSTSENPFGFSNAQDGFDNTALIDEELETYRLEATISFEDSLFTSVNLGVNYRDQTKSKANLGFFLIANTFPFDGAIPEELRRGETDLGFAGLGRFIAYDAQAAVDSDRYYTRISAANLEPDRLGDTYSVSETVLTPFVKAGFETELGGMRVFGNVGAQYQMSKQENQAFASQINSDFVVEASPISGSHKYDNFLPSLNFNVEVAENQLVRLGLAKVITRPRIDQLGQGSSVRFNTAIESVTSTDPQTSAWTSRSGNIHLEPFEANQFDLSYEWYYSDLGYLSATYFYKDLVNWNRSSARIRDYSDVYVPGFHQAVNADTGAAIEPTIFLGVDSFAEGGLEGDVSGVELQASVNFGDFVDGLDGLGFVVSGAFSDGELDDGGRIPGMSDTVLQATLFYEVAGFEFRVATTDRDDFLSEQRGGSNSIATVNRRGATLVDAQISYDFAESGISLLEGLRVSLQGQNLSDEVDTLVDEQSGAVILSEKYGSNYLLTFNYSLF